MTSQDAPAVPDEDEVFDAVRAAVIEVVRAPEVSRRDNFFDLGGHSMTAMRVIARLRDRYGPDLPLALMFETDDLGELVASIREYLAG